MYLSRPAPTRPDVLDRDALHRGVPQSGTCPDVRYRDAPPAIAELRCAPAGACFIGLRFPRGSWCAIRVRTKLP